MLEFRIDAPRSPFDTGPAAASARSGRRHGPAVAAALAATVAVALGLRLAQLSTLARVPYFTLLQVDARAYHERAMEIAGGDWKGGGVAYQDPLYPWFLAAIYRLAGDNPLAAVAVQMLLGLATVAMTAAMAGRLAGPPAAVVAGMLAAAYRPFLFYESLLLKGALSTALLTAAILLVLAPDRRRAVASAGGGLALGLALLTQGQVWFLVPLLGLGAWRAARGRGLALLLLGFLLAVFPSALRNRLAGGEWVLTTSQMGQNFYTGNGPHVVDGRFRSPDFVRANPAFEEADFRARAERLAGRRLSARETSRFWLGEALREIAARPGRAARNFALKLGEALSAYEVPDNLNLDFERTRLPVLDLPLASFGLVAPFGLAGALLALRREGAARLAAVAVLVWLAGIAVFFVFARYRLPIVPVLIAFAASFTCEAASALGRRDARALAPLAALLALAALAVHRPVEPVGPAQARVNLGKAWAERAGELFRAGRADEARHHIEQAVGEFERASADAPGWAQPCFHEGLARATAGDRAGAERALREALRREPDHVWSLALLARLLEGDGRWVEARELRDRAHEADPAGARAAEENLR